MINTDLLWYLLIPVFFTCITILVLHKFVRNITWWQSVGAASFGLLITLVITIGFFYGGRGFKTADVEILNGEVLSKSRVHGSYVESYECNCHQVCSGSDKNRSCSSECDTCYRDHYTVTWSCSTNIGNFHIDSDDWTSQSVYNLPDPPRYSIIHRGDPVSSTRNYTNYIKAVPETLFRPAQQSLKRQFTGKIPAYPDKVYDLYHVDRVISIGANIPDIRYWNSKLADALKILGPSKQANAVIVIVNIADPNYFYALQDAWLNGKKNDIVLVIGAPSFPQQAAWVKIMDLSQDSMLQIKLRDDILDLKTLTADNVINALARDTLSYFKRKHMSDFKYLEAEIDPPFWCMMICVILITLAYTGFWIYVYLNRDARAFGRFGQPRFR